MEGGLLSNSKQSVLDFSGIELLPEAAKDIRELAKRYGKPFIMQLQKVMAYFNEYGDRITDIDHHERLKSTGVDYPLYSLHMQSKIYNIRAIATIDDSKKLVLSAFFERSDDKRRGYTAYIQKSIERFESHRKLSS